jgi:signal transduction histidine kinase/CheY-like chemotaxis protein
MSIDPQQFGELAAYFEADDRFGQRLALQLLEQAPVGIALTTGPSHRIQFANRLCRAMTGRDKPDGLPLPEAFGAPADAELAQALDEALSQGHPAAVREFALPHGTDPHVGEARFVRFSIDPLRTSAGQVCGLIVSAADISDRVRSRIVLERADHERRRLQGELEAARRRKDEVVTMLGHELRDPLAPIVNGIELMKRRGGEADPALDLVSRQIRRLVDLVDGLQNSREAERGQIELRLEPCRVDDLLMQAVERTRVARERRGQHLAIDMPQRPLLCWADAERLIEVFVTLLDNASRFSGPGDMVEVRMVRRQDEILLGVADHGRGIDTQALPHVFRPFFQTGQGLGEQPAGGIGLAAVKQVVAMHGGTIAARSSGAGLGSEFTIRLPRLQRETPSAHGALAPQPAGQQRVLIVDDNHDAAVSMADLLRLVGYEVQVFNDPRQALEAAVAFRPQAAVLDLAMPEMDGYELAEALQKRLPLGSCRFIAVTGFEQQSDRQRSAEAGFEAHLVKPVLLDQLLPHLQAPVG